MLWLLLLAAAPLTPAGEMKKGHFAKALELVDQSLARVKPKSKDARRLQKLHDTLSTKVTVFEVFTEPEGAALTVDGVSAHSPVTLDPGPHTFHVEAFGFLPLERAATAVAGIRPNLTLVLERVPEPEPVSVTEPVAVAAADPEHVTEPSRAPPAAVEVPRARPAPARDSIVPYFLGGLGVIAGITGGTLLITAELQHIHSARYVAGISVAGLGGALLLSAVLWLLVERRPGANLR